MGCIKKGCSQFIHYASKDNFVMSFYKKYHSFPFFRYRILCYTQSFKGRNVLYPLLVSDKTPRFKNIYQSITANIFFYSSNGIIFAARLQKKTTFVEYLKIYYGYFLSKLDLFEICCFIKKYVVL